MNNSSEEHSPTFGINKVNSTDILESLDQYFENLELISKEKEEKTYQPVTPKKHQTM